MAEREVYIVRATRGGVEQKLTVDRLTGEDKYRVRIDSEVERAVSIDVPYSVLADCWGAIQVDHTNEPPYEPGQ